MNEDNIRSIIEPNSIAVIGASNKTGSVGNAVIKNILNGGFRGKIYPVNPSGNEIMGIKCYGSVKEVSESIDLAVVIVPNKVVASYRGLW